MILYYDRYSFHCGKYNNNELTANDYNRLKPVVRQSPGPNRAARRAAAKIAKKARRANDD